MAIVSRFGRTNAADVAPDGAQSEMGASSTMMAHLTVLEILESPRS
jgi:hypothetical protein